MTVSDDRKYTKDFVYNLLESVKGKTLGEVDKSRQFARTQKSEKITGIAGDVVEQSVFGYSRDSRQECDIEIDGVHTELKTTGVRIPKGELKDVQGKSGEAYNMHLAAKEGISITGVTFEPDIQKDFQTSHFWEKSAHLLIVFYEYKSYSIVPASAYADFPIVGYCYNTFSEEERLKLQNDWEIVRDYLQEIYSKYKSFDERYEHLVGFTHRLRPRLLLIELVPGFRKKSSGAYQKPRYRLKQTFVDYLVRGHFNKNRSDVEVALKVPFSSFGQLDDRCHMLSEKYRGKTIGELTQLFGIEAKAKDVAAKCVLKMFDAGASRLNQISDFTKTGIIAKTITTTSSGGRTEDMKLMHINFEEWADRDVDFAASEVYNYFCEHCFLFPIFCERGDTSPRKADETRVAYEERIDKTTLLTTFEGFKRLSFDDAFIDTEVRRTWEDSRKLIFRNQLKWNYEYDRNGNKRINGSGAYMGAPNFPKSSNYNVFFRGGASVSNEKTRTEVVNGIRMLPQFVWLKGTFITNKLNETSFL